MPAAAKAESCRIARRTYRVAPTTDSSVAIEATSAFRWRNSLPTSAKNGIAATANSPHANDLNDQSARSVWDAAKFACEKGGKGVGVIVSATNATRIRTPVRSPLEANRNGFGVVLNAGCGRMNVFLSSLIAMRLCRAQ